MAARRLGFSLAKAYRHLREADPIVGALIFPVGFVMVVLLGFELATGNFALLPAAWMDQRISAGAMSRADLIGDNPSSAKALFVRSSCFAAVRQPHAFARSR